MFMPIADEASHNALMPLLPPSLRQQMSDLITNEHRCVHCVLRRTFEWRAMWMNTSCNACTERFIDGQGLSQHLPDIENVHFVRKLKLCREHMECIEEEEVPVVSAGMWHVLVRIGGNCRVCRGEIYSPRVFN